MALNIRNPETAQLAASLAKETGESKTEAVTKALKDRLAPVKQRKARRRLADELDEIGKHCAAFPLLNSRSEEEILGYDQDGLPHS